MSATRPIVIVGAGGHGRELLGLLDAVNALQDTWEVLGFVDDGPVDTGRVARLGHRVIGDTDWLDVRPVDVALGVGSSAVRRALAERLASTGHRFPVLVHPEASVGEDVELGEGVVVYQRSVITTNVRIGAHTHLNVACVVQHDTHVGSFVQFSPGVLVNGDCTLGDDVFMGSAAVITRGCAVGTGTRVGAGAVVLTDIPAGVTAVGAPARPVP